MAYKYPICYVFHWFCKITRFFATESEMLYAGVVGLIMGLLFYKTKSLPFVAVLHGFVNVFLFGILPHHLIGWTWFWASPHNFCKLFPRDLRTSLILLFISVSGNKLTNPDEVAKWKTWPKNLKKNQIEKMECDLYWMQT